MTIDANSMLQKGALLHNNTYRIDNYLSSGGFGNTYRATNIEFNEVVAIKELFLKGICQRNTDSTVSVSNSTNSQLFDQQLVIFKREAQRLRQLNKSSNRHIIKVHDLFEENGTAYYVMDYIDGKSLESLLEDNGKPFNTEWLKKNILPQILDALDVLHHYNLWHLDIKPSNIMLDNNDNATLIDFGTSKQIEPYNTYGLTSVTALTPGYAAIELQENNKKKIGPWTDLYSLGATLYNLATGKNPPKISDINDNGINAFLLLPDDDSNFKKLVAWMMQIHVDKRPQSVTEIRQTITNNYSIQTVSLSKNSDNNRDNLGIDNQTIISKKKKKEKQHLPLFLLLLALLGIIGFALYNSTSRQTSTISTAHPATTQTTSTTTQTTSTTKVQKPKPKPKQPLPTGIYAFIGRCNVRSGPSTTYSVVYEANNGEPCFYDGVHQGDWYYIEIAFGGVTPSGWTHRDNLKQLDHLPDP